MRFIMMHVNSFCSRITEKGRSKFIEPPDPQETRVGESIVVLISVEAGDEDYPRKVAEEAAVEMEKNALNLKVKTIVLHPFAHLFAKLGPPEPAVGIMDSVKEILLMKGFEVIRTPFGWFNTLEIDAKGHPYSRVARIVDGHSS